MDRQKDFMLVGATLAVLLSLFSLIYSFAIIDSPSPTGHISKNASGKVDISVRTFLSITLVNSTIDFGACAINRTKNYSVIDSDLGPHGLDNDDCTGGNFPGYLIVENNGNLDANVSVSANYTADEFFNYSGSWYAFKARDHPDRPGCLNADLQDSYQNFSTTDPMMACDNLTFSPGNDAFQVSVKAFLYRNTTSRDSASILFEAHQVG
ncbi:MAG: hypothetical protein ACLFTH_00680 [Candidatus Woesearchaeota archaeon]